MRIFHCNACSNKKLKGNELIGKMIVTESIHLMG